MVVSFKPKLQKVKALLQKSIQRVTVKIINEASLFFIKLYQSPRSTFPWRTSFSFGSPKFLHPPWLHSWYHILVAIIWIHDYWSQCQDVWRYARLAINDLFLDLLSIWKEVKPHMQYRFYPDQQSNEEHQLNFDKIEFVGDHILRTYQALDDKLQMRKG